MHPALPFDFTQADNGKVLMAGRLLVVGVAVEETTGAAIASVITGDSGTVGQPGVARIPFQLAASESVRDWFWPGIVYERGLVLTITGSVLGSVFIIPESLLDANHWAANIWGGNQQGEHVI